MVARESRAPPGRAARPPAAGGRRPPAGGASATSTFWRALSVGIRLNCWKMNPIVVRRSRARSASPIRPSGSPSKRISPALGRSSAPSSWSTVVLPDPLGPMIATYSPPLDLEVGRGHRDHLAGALPVAFLDRLQRVEHSSPLSRCGAGHRQGAAARHGGFRALRRTARPRGRGRSPRARGRRPRTPRASPPRSRPGSLPGRTRPGRGRRPRADEARPGLGRLGHGGLELRADGAHERCAAHADQRARSHRRARPGRAPRRSPGARPGAAASRSPSASPARACAW